MKRLDRKIAFVTGGAGGIGRAIVEKFAAEGALVTFADADEAAGMFEYAAAKAGPLGLTRSLALDYGPLGIRVNAVSPAYIRTWLVDEWIARQPDPAASERATLANHPLRRIATVTGANLAVDCGLGAMFAS